MQFGTDLASKIYSPKFLAIAGGLLLLSACSLSSNIEQLNSARSFEGKISGSVIPLESASVNSAQNQALCSSPQVSLYRLHSSGAKITPSVMTAPVANDGAYELTVDKNFDYQSSQNSYLLEVIGCNSYYARRLTGFEKQNIDYGTSALSFTVGTAWGAKLADADTEKITRLFSRLSTATSWSDLHSQLTNDMEARQLINEVFQGNASFLLDLPPRILSINVPSTFHELQAHAITANFFHFDPSYNTAVIWKIDSTVLANSTNANWTPGANTQGSRVLSLYAGKDNGAGLDFTRPSISQTYPVVITNDFPATPPALTIAGGVTATNSLNINALINTGAALSDCQSFSTLAITENDLLAPLSPAEYQLQCSTPVSQVLPFTLSPGDGIKTLRLWALDASGNISTFSQNASILLDQTGPDLSLTPGRTIFRGGEIASINWSANDTGSGLQKVELWYSDDNGNTYTLLSDLTAQSSPFLWTVPNLNLSTIRLRMTATDFVTNSSVVTSVALTIDSIAPSLSITAPAALTPSQAGITLSGTCETGLPVEVAGTGMPVAVSAICIAGNFSQPLIFSLGDGIKNIVITQTDHAGNSSTDSRDFILDLTPPAITVTSPIDGTSASSGVTLIGSCETGLPISIAGSGILSPLTINCSGGTYSQAIFFSASDGVKSISVSQTDLAGNTGTVNRNFLRDTTPPVVTQTAQVSPYETNTDSVTFGGSCEAGLTVSVSGGVDTGTTTCPSGTWSYTTATQTTEATRVYTFSQTDSAGNTGSVNASWVRDTTPPALTITSTVNFQTSSNSVTYAGACETGRPIVVTGADATSFACSGGSWSYVTTKNTDATYNYTFTQTDPAGNTHHVDGSWVRNTQGPVITITSTTPVLSSNNNQTITGTCTNGLAITVSNAISDSIVCSSGIFSYAVTAATDASRQYDFSQTDAFLNTSTASATWVRDTTAPSLTNSSMVIGTGSGTVGSSYTKVSFAATDNLTRITDFCVKVDDTSNPPGTDACWTSLTATPPNVTPAISVSIVNFPFLLSFDPGAHDVYLWVRDELGNISSQNGIAGRDMRSVNYVPVTPPSVNAVIATSSDSPANPPLPSEMTVSAGQNIYLKWSATGTLGGAPISIYFTTDDITWSPLTSGISNIAQSGCTPDHPSSTADDGMTGCYLVSSPTGGIIRLRVGVTDTNGNVAYKSSGLFNTGVVRIIAGNVDDGLYGSATKAMLFNRISNMYHSDTGNFVLLNDGRFIFNDKMRGILIVNPEDGLLKPFIAVTGTSTGDNGSATNATLRWAIKIALDYQGRLLIWDYDRIRRVDFNTNTISTIIGGGTDTSDNVMNALSVKIRPEAGISNVSETEQGISRYAILTPLPNGDIYFQSEDYYYHVTGNRFRVYSPGASPQVRSFYPHGVGNSFGNPNDISASSLLNLRLSFNPGTSVIENFYVSTINVYGRSAFRKPGVVGDEYEESRLDPMTYTPVSNVASDHVGAIDNGPCCGVAWTARVTGMDGKLYGVYRVGGLLRKYDSLSKTWSTILGNGFGVCADGTPALSCRVKLADVFITSSGKIYFMDDGRLRTITASGTVTTIYGQSFTSGNGGSPLQARFGVISEISAANDGSLIITDNQSFVLREINANRSLIQHVTGNSSAGWPALGTDVTNLPIQMYNDRIGMIYDPVTKDIYNTTVQGNAYITRLNRSTNKWEAFVGGGSTDYKSGDGLVANQLGGLTSLTRVIGYGNGSILMQTAESWYDDSTDAGRRYANPSTRLYNVSTGIQSTLTEKSGQVPYYSGGVYLGLQFCPDETPLNSCQSSILWWAVGAPAVYDPIGARWFFVSPHTPRIAVADPSVGTMQTLATLPRNPSGLAYRRSGGYEFVYYCGGDLKLYKYNVTLQTETRLNLPSTMTCSSQTAYSYSNSVIYDPANDKILFIAYQNGLFGVAQIDP